jgi:hypothetical protein
MSSLEKILKTQKTYLATYLKIVDMYKIQISGFVPIQHPFFNDHGVGHAERVIEYLDKLLEEEKNYLSKLEVFILLTAAWLHDIGMMINVKDGKTLSNTEIRQYHHELSRIFIRQHYQILGLPNRHIGYALADICYCHRRTVKIESIFTKREPFEFLGDSFRPRFLSALLRIADSMDCDARRAPELITNVIMKLPEKSRKHWLVCQSISGVDVSKQDSALIVDGSYTSSSEKKLLKEKVLDLYDEIKTVDHLLVFKKGLHIVNVIGRFQDSEKNEFQVTGKELKDASIELKRKKKEFYRELACIWSTRKPRASKISESHTLYLKSKHNVVLYEELPKIIYLSWKNRILYKKNGFCLVETICSMLNISDVEVKEAEYSMGGVEPMSGDEIRLEVHDEDNKRACDWEFIEDNPLRKAIRYSFKPIPPSQTRKFKLRHFWRYPGTLEGLRWNKKEIADLYISFEETFLFPSKGYNVKDVSVFKEYNNLIENMHCKSPFKGKRYIRVTFRGNLPELGASFNTNVMFVKS